MSTTESTKRLIRAVRQTTDSIHGSDIAGLWERKMFFKNGKDFLLQNSFEEEDRRSDQMIIFGTNESVEMLKNSKNWYADGTFNISPTAFHQVYPIHYSHNDRVFSCVYAVLSSKRQSVYERLFNQMKEFCGENEPETITFDFEMPAINAARTVSPSSELKGCFFHLFQAFYRKIQFLGLKN